MTAKSIRLFLLRVLLYIATMVPAAAAEIAALTENGQTIVTIGGIISPGDYEAFLNAVQDRSRAVVVLESPGGDLREGLAIAAEIALLGLTTYVGDGSGCFSACALIWVSGATRIMDEGATIGVHAAYYLVESVDGEMMATISSVGNANVGAFLNALGLDIDAVDFFVEAPPEEIAILTPARAQVLNIPVVLITPTGDMHRLVQRSPRHFAAVAALYTLIGTSCATLFDADPAFYRGQAELALQEVHLIIGPEAGFEYLSQEMRGLQFDMDSAGPLDWCIGALLLLADAELPMGVDSPSFPCDRASTASEVAICRERRLWVHDRALSTIYAALRLTVNESSRLALVDQQRAWLEQRNTCEADTACLEALHLSRLREMHSN